MARRGCKFIVCLTSFNREAYDMATLLDMAVDALKQQLETPKADIEKNIRAVLEEMVSKMDLVTAHEMARHQLALDNAHAQIHALNARLDALLAQHQAPNTTQEP